MTDTSLFDLTGKVAVITGSTKGIGKAIAYRMAQHGAKVVISSRKADLCDEVAGEINAAFGKNGKVAVPIACNISYKEQLENLVAKSREAFGKIDVLVCNAAVNPYAGPMANCPDDAFDKIMSVNVRSNVWLCNLVVPEMKARKDGSIIIVSSIGGLRGSNILGAYCISKAADFQLVRNLAVEYGADNIRANAIAPGLIQTDFARYLWENPDILKVSTANAPLKRIGQPDEIAGMAVFLASKGGGFATGQQFVLDGGATIT
ncbi:MAG: glucose 1-dehydrogenase [Alphaproteobacteria bacterium]|nr:glucose 1-dehydrogenase [Alphaproteobacteria bacterium]